MSNPPSGMEPQIGGHGSPSADERADADQCFNQALDFIRRERWDAAAESLRDALELVHDYPQASGLLALIRDIQQTIMRGGDERQKIEAMRAYIYAFQNAPSAMTPRPVPSAPAPRAAAIALPWADDATPQPRDYPPGHFRDLPRVTAPIPATTDPYMPSGGPMSTEEKARPPLPSLSPFNPLDQLRVLWWFFMQPGYIKLYLHEGHGHDMERVTGWLSSTILWSGLAIPALGLAFATLPSPGLPMLWMLGVVIAMWAVCGWLMGNNSGSVALMLASAVWVVLIPIVMNFAGDRTGLVVALIFLLLAGFAAGVNGTGPNRSAAHLALGATYVTTVAAVFKMYTFIAPVVWAYVGGFILGDVGGPILIALAVLGVGLFALGVTYAIPFITTHFIAFTIEAVVDDSLGSGASPFSAATLVAMVALYGVLVWISFAGGWRIVDRLF